MDSRSYELLLKITGGQLVLALGLLPLSIVSFEGEMVSLVATGYI
jgi:hypothetical protein